MKQNMDQELAQSEYAIPALYEGPMPPPSYQVPPDDVSLWSEEDERFIRFGRRGHLRELGRSSGDLSMW